jgi:hypothetical protein
MVDQTERGGWRSPRLLLSPRTSLPRSAKAHAHEKLGPKGIAGVNPNASA